MTPLPGGAASRATAVVQDGVIYLTGGANAFAFDARTGEPVWHWEPELEAGRVPSWQGVVLGDGLVFFGTRSGEVLALRQETGELVWATRVGSREQTRGETVTAAPMYSRGKVFVGLANGDIGGQGRVLALDAATGEVEWTFFVVPRPGRARPRNLAGGQRLLGVRRRRCLAGRHGRSGSRDGLLLHRQPGADVRRRATRGG